MEALVLAAGFGTRFRPQTLETPKPLLPFLGRPILFHLLDHLVEQGVSRFVVNAHHLAERLRAGVGAAWRGRPVAISHEEEILGTAGAIRRACENGLLTGSEFLVVNGDLYTTLPVGRLPAARPEGALSAMAVLPNEAPARETPLWSGDGGRLDAVGAGAPAGSSGPWLFTGIAAVRREILDRIPAGRSELASDLLRPSAARRDGAFALVPFRAPEDGFWFDLGSPERLAAAERAVSGATSPRQ